MVVPSHVAFQTWEARGESLDSVEKRIHDGVPLAHLHRRANEYLDTLEILFPESKPKPGGQILEIGSGVGYVMEAAARRYAPRRIVGLDVASGMIEKARERFARDGVDTGIMEFVHYDGVDVPLPSDSFDYIYSVASLQHAPRPFCFRVLSEALRLVKSSGAVSIHLLAYSHFENYMTPDQFALEIDQQVRGRAGHWHHYYSVQEIDKVLRYGLGVEQPHVLEQAGSLFFSFGKTRRNVPAGFGTHTQQQTKTPQALRKALSLPKRERNLPAETSNWTKAGRRVQQLWTRGRRLQQIEGLLPTITRWSRWVASAAPTAARWGRSPLGEEQEASWDNDGYVVLPRLFSQEQVGRMNALVDELWATRKSDDRDLIIDVFIGTPNERRIRFRNAPDEARFAPYKLDDVYLVSDLARAMVLDKKLVRVLDRLLVGSPVAFNSLTFERGSQQDFHFDTFYMPPSVPNKMCASWIALEDIDESAGPLVFYPGSHKIPPYYFSDGRLNVTLEELGSFREYIGRELENRGLRPVTFPARAGDVFIWHAQLFHGGAPIVDMTRTRRSIVTHYFRVREMAPGAVVDIGDGRFYLQRPHQQAFE
ncbi:MAG: hypothetical protein DMF89_05185 [Acidobacteria bacterium]|nr:MAG: hypothetical protein DMF89_05185 [Acidobacteriota bacterium]